MKRIAPFVVLLAACHSGAPIQTPSPPSPGGAQSPTDAAIAGGTTRAAFAVVESPVSLTASDGTGLRISSLRAKSVIDGALAFTEMQLSFENPSDRTLEGTFRIALPHSASLGRFAMKIGDAWQEGEVVELEAARRAYEDFLHRKQDPALMEKAAGNEFSARVFPIPAHGTKEIVVSYVEEVKGEQYTLPLKGLPELGDLVVEAKVLGAPSQPGPLTLHGSAPTADFVIPVRQAGSVRSSELAIVHVQPQADSKPEALDNTIVLVDTSASRVLGFSDEMKALDDVMKKIAEKDGTATVAAFDQVVAPIFSGKARSFSGKEIATIQAREALGASNLERALTWARDTAKTNHAKRVVLITDGVATAGATDPKKLLPKVTALKEAGVERIDAVAIGGIRDDAMLARIVHGILPHDGVVAEASEAPRRLGEATTSAIAVKIEGATWSYPQKLMGVQAGDAFTVYAELPASSPLRVSIGGAAFKEVNARGTDRPLIERAVAQAKVTSLLEREASGKDSLKKQITQIAIKQRIMTPYTAMLVLETESDYAQYGIDRKSLTDVLAIQDGAVRRVHRTGVKLPLARPVDDGADILAKNALMESSLVDDKPEPQPARSAAPMQKPSPEPAPAMKKYAKDDEEVSASKRPKAARPVEADDDEEPKAMARSSRPAPAAAPPPSPARRPRSQAGPMPAATSGASADDSVVSARSELEGGDSGGSSEHAQGQNPYEGKLRDVMDRIKEKRPDEAMKLAHLWRQESPGDVLALVALGESAEAKGQIELAARAYGSVIDLFSNRADLRRFAGERLERLSLKDGSALDLAVDTFEKALADRADHPSSHRLLTFALVRKKEYARAFENALAATRRAFEVDRFAGVDRILREDLGLVGAAWAHDQPARKDEILGRVRAAGGAVESQPSVRFVLNWETDANDVDFHIHDARGGHAYFSDPHLRSGGDLYADVTTGYGPECFTIRGPKAKRAGPYMLEAHYYSRGPMGYGMGKLEVIEHDGNGVLTFDERPFIVMVDQAFVDLGAVQ